MWFKCAWLACIYKTRILQPIWSRWVNSIQLIRICVETQELTLQSLRTENNAAKNLHQADFFACTNWKGRSGRLLRGGSLYIYGVSSKSKYVAIISITSKVSFWREVAVIPCRFFTMLDSPLFWLFLGYLVCMIPRGAREKCYFSLHEQFIWQYGAICTRY